MKHGQSIGDQRRELEKGARLTRRHWLTLSLVRHGPFVAPWTHASFNDLLAFGFVTGVPRRSTDGANRLLTTKVWTITPAGIDAYNRGAQAPR